MKFEDFTFGRIRVDGTLCDHDLVVDRGKTRKRKKKPSKKYRDLVTRGTSGIRKM